MNRMNTLAISVALTAQPSVFGGVVIHTSYASWSASVGGGDAKIDFNLGASQDLAGQYESIGVTFDGTPFVTTMPSSDGWGVITPFPTFSISATFETAQNGIAFDFMSLFKVSLFSSGVLVYQSPQLNTFGPVFRGLSTDFSFDKAVIESIPETVPGAIDNLYLANPVPGPGSAVIMMMALCVRQRRRR